MSFYDIPEKEEGFEAAKAFNVRVKESGMTAEKLLRTYINGYERFWQTPRTHGDRALTMDQMQQVLLQDPVAMNDLMTDGTAFVAFVQASHPEKIGTEYFPERYLTIPYVMNELGQLISLKPEWEAPVEEEV